MNLIYLDHNATTPIRMEVVDTMRRAYAESFANPASQHQPGQRARRVLEETREKIASLLGADLTCPQPDRLIFTSGGTESNNLAILGIAQRAGIAKTANPPQIIISSIEHQCVIEPAEYLLEQDFRLDTLPVNPNGVVHWESLAPLLTSETRLVSVILANHETGVMQPITQISQLCNSKNVLLHTDAVQAVGKQLVNFRELGVAAMSIAAHKFEGPLGIGALILRHDVELKPLFYGGHQQFGLRSGTESIPLASGMLTALELAVKQQEERAGRISELRRRFENRLREGFSEIVIHGEEVPRLPNTSNIAFPGLDGQILLMALDMAGVACSVGSACSSGSTELSPTLRAMGLPNEIVSSSLRFSLSTTTTEAEIDEAVARILRVCREIHG